MKSIKTLGLAMVAVLATMALVGVANASAKQAVELCQVKDQTPCTSPLAIGTEIKSELATGTEAILTAGETVVKCKKSTVSGKTTETQKEEGEVKQQLIGKIESTTWTECKAGIFSCTATALQLPWTAHLNQKENQEQNNGDMYVGPQPEKEQPGAKIVCAGFVTCEYKANEVQPGHVGNLWTKLQVLGTEKQGEEGEVPATIIANEVQLKKVSGGALCGATGKWNATYKVTSPSPLYVTHQNT